MNKIRIDVIDSSTDLIYLGVGGVISINKILYKCHIGEHRTRCPNCSFYNKFNICIIMRCSNETRNDDRSVYFKKVE